MPPRIENIRILSILWIVIALNLRPAIAGTQPASQQPPWCNQLPRAAFAKFERVPINDAWFEVYKVAPATFAIYEPRQSEETIGYLIVGNTRALLFDTGMGIGNLKALTIHLTRLPIVFLNSHTHNDHVGNNWQFDTVYGMDTDFTRLSARGSKQDAQAEIAPGEICGSLPTQFDRGAYQTRPWKISKWLHDGDHIDLGGKTIEVLATPGHTPDAICIFDRAGGLLFTGDTFYPGTIWLYRPETDLAAYGTSVNKLADLQPQVKIVLGAHNLPVSPPTVLTDLAGAFAKVGAGQVQPKPAGNGKVVYKVGNISFLMRPPAGTQ
jgi:glyoxylase-like metal-dependent hydrolase (beta-lactamase superfamily II)